MQHRGLRPRGDDEVIRLDVLASYTQLARPHEAGATVPRRDATLDEFLFARFRDWARERALETHQRGPVDARRLCLQPLPPHSLDPIQCLSSTYEDLLRVAAAECASSSVRSRVHDGGAMTCLLEPPCDRGSCRTGSDRYEIESLTHEAPSRGVDIVLFTAFLATHLDGKLVSAGADLLSSYVRIGNRLLVEIMSRASFIALFTSPKQHAPE